MCRTWRKCLWKQRFRDFLVNPCLFTFQPGTCSHLLMQHSVASYSPSQLALSWASQTYNNFNNSPLTSSREQKQWWMGQQSKGMLKQWWSRGAWCRGPPRGRACCTRRTAPGRAPRTGCSSPWQRLTREGLTQHWIPRLWGSLSLLSPHLSWSSESRDDR